MGPWDNQSTSEDVLSTEQRDQQDRSESETLNDQSTQSQLTDLASIFKLLEQHIITFVKSELKRLKRLLTPDYPECFDSQEEDQEVVDTEHQESSTRAGTLNITLHILRNMNQKELADTLEKYERDDRCQHECVFEGIAKQGNPTLLNKIYTELYITEGGSGEVNKEHEDSGVVLLSTGLDNPLCKLETLSLSACRVREEGCTSLASALRSNPSHLRELDLSYNNPGDSGVELLSAVLEDPHYELETLRLSNCDVTDKDTPRLSCCRISEDSCASLASALRSNPSHLRELDLTDNEPGDSGVELLSAVLEDPHCELQTLSLSWCVVKEEGFGFLASALRSNPSHLRELDLSKNTLGDSTVELLSVVLEDCKLERLRLSHCSVTEEDCAFLASALRSNPSHLRELDLDWNPVVKLGLKELSVVLDDPLCQLETLRLSEDPRCKLEKLSLYSCQIKEEGCAALASALRSNPSHLRELDLSYNNPGDSGVELLSAVLEDPLCQLEILKLWHCAITEEGFASLASALKSTPSRMWQLELRTDQSLKSHWLGLNPSLELCYNDPGASAVINLK
ncbi:hypothetical protein J4Q44_G00114340 [Coregonus suidteri]|uniref:FISNA domain-containing protein n=1 Tax=Coregonus suidteri TaxID=861788 RepID=A0AAN8LVW4_9TELE